MNGCRSFSDQEIAQLLEQLGRNRYPLRDRALLLLGIKTGFRISELRSLTLGDVWQNGRLVDQVAVGRRFMKGKQVGRAVPLKNAQARAALEAWIHELFKMGLSDPQTYLFRSREGGNRAICRTTAYRILTRAADRCDMTGKIGTHSMRKSFAKQMRALLGNDLHALQIAMGHKEITSTMRYDEVDEGKVGDAFRKL